MGSICGLLGNNEGARVRGAFVVGQPTPAMQPDQPANPLCHIDESGDTLWITPICCRRSRACRTASARAFKIDRARLRFGTNTASSGCIAQTVTRFRPPAATGPGGT